jgi:beta-N-acetylhexosaminidase
MKKCCLHWPLASLVIAMGVATALAATSIASERPSLSLAEAGRLWTDGAPIDGRLLAQSDTSQTSATTAPNPYRRNLHEIPLSEKIGQMLMVGFIGDSVLAPGVQALIRQVQDGKVGSVLYLGNNVKSLQAVAEMNRAFLNARPDLPVLIAVDQEGGFIQRLKPKINFENTPSAERVAATMAPAAAQELYRDLAKRLRNLDFNLNLGPVVDVNVNKSNPIIARFKRAYSDDPEIVATYAQAFVDGHTDAGVLTALKHFPGHGSSRQDTHLGFTDITATWDHLELEPYKQLINQGTVDMVMTGHLYHSGLNADGESRVPATLSAKILSKLRNEFGYSGVIITDDLQMGAIRKHFSPEDALIKAVLAGNDILMFSAFGKNPSAKPDWVINTLTNAARNNDLIIERIDESYLRVLRLKRKIAPQIVIPRNASHEDSSEPRPVDSAVDQAANTADARATEFSATIDASSLQTEQRNKGRRIPEVGILSAEEMSELSDTLGAEAFSADQAVPPQILGAAPLQTAETAPGLETTPSGSECEPLSAVRSPMAVAGLSEKSYSPGEPLLSDPVVYKLMRECLLWLSANRLDH